MITATTITTALRQAQAQLQPHSDDATLDARLLLAHATGWSHTYLFSHPQAPLDPPARQHFAQLVARRAAGEPLAYIIGECGFWTLTLAVNPSVLVPRPDTETLVEAALELLPKRTCTVADLGTGSGAIALALASERPQWSLLASDASAAALACARANAQRLALANVHFVHGSWLQPLRGKRLDAIVANPPYVGTADPHLQAPALRHEPREALVAADDGLADLAHLAARAPSHLVPGGWLLLEHGYNQAVAVRRLLCEAGLSAVATRTDLGGRPRVTLGRLA
ncbi:MAG TPA: peptide chain release factor N(5)-glutamine methyltransferase [Salinisphaeraceae bacterium]|nr:peptide chain release factor N(5)-glutamine methyltransferase [Salinisphaeraceae bacterium]